MRIFAKFISGLVSAAIAINFAAPAVNIAMAAADDTIASLSEVIKNGLQNYETEIDISKFEIDPTTKEGQGRIIEVLTYVRKLPELFCVEYENGFNVVPVSGPKGTIVAAKLKVVYNNTKEEADALLGELNSKIDEVIAENITPGMTELQMALELHDYLVLNTVYDTDKSLPDRNGGGSAYDILVCGNGVCEGYAQAYNMLLDRVGMSSIMVTSIAMNHAWNLVNVDNEWYHVDTTWDDPVPDAQGMVNHKYFLLSDKEIRTESDRRSHIHHSWDSKGLLATSTKYDNAFWSGIGTEIFIRGDKWYFVSEDGEYSTYVESTGEVNTFVSVCEEKWYEWGKTNSMWAGKYASLIISGDKVFFNTPTQLYKMNLDGSEKQSLRYVDPYYKNPAGPEGYLYGLRLINNKIYGVIKKSPMEEGELYELIDADFQGKVSVIETLLHAVADMKDGQSQSFNMETESILPKEAIEAIRGKNISISLNLEGYSWNIEGTSVTAEKNKAEDLNLEIRQDQGVIPDKMISMISGSHSKVVELNLQHDGPFGLRAGIDYDLGQQFENNTAVLYYYNQAESRMDKIDTAMVDTSGNLRIDLEHASSYAVVLREPPAPDDPVIGEEGKPPENPGTEEITAPEPPETQISAGLDVEDVRLGDINNDCIIDLTDLSLLSLACLGEKTLSESQQKSADVTRDGKVTLADLATMRQYVTKVILEF